MSIIIFFVIIMILAYHCSCSYKENMTNMEVVVKSSNTPLTVSDNDILVEIPYREDMSLLVENEYWGHNINLWDCNIRPDKEMVCPPGYYISGIADSHGCGNDEGRNLNFMIKCSKAIGFNHDG